MVSVRQHELVLLLICGSCGARTGLDTITDGGTAGLDVVIDEGSSTKPSVLFGGAAGEVWPADTWTWDGATWTKLDVVGPSARDNAMMAALNDNVVLFGGSDAGVLGDTWTWDGTR